MCLTPIRSRQGIIVPCGQCVECALQYTREWALRVLLEASLYKSNCFLTLTYNEDNLPDGASLKKSDFQKFMKKIRWHLKEDFAIEIRFFACGEYGKKKRRPHYHVAIFNFIPSDLVYYKTDKKGFKLYKSKYLADIWDKGFITVGALNELSARYVCKYMLKGKIVKGKLKPFTLSSKGVGFGAVNWNSIVSTDKIYFNGRTYRTPRAFLEKIKRDFVNGDIIVEDIMSRRSKTLEPFIIDDEALYYADNPFEQAIFNYNSDFHNLKVLEHYSSIRSEQNFIYDKACQLEIEDLNNRREKYKNIFGKSLDKKYRLII